MNTPQDSSTDIEHINFTPSILLEGLIIDFGKMLCTSLIEATRIDELEVLNELIGEFMELASAYGEQTGRIPEALGVSLNEAALMKLQGFMQQKDSSEWKYYAQQTKDILDKLKV